VASIQKRGESYRVRIIRKGYPPHTKTFSNKGDAIRWSRMIETKLDQGLLPLHSEQVTCMLDKSPLLFSHAADHYIKTHSIHKKIVRSETYRLKILSKRWGDLPIQEVNKTVILDLRDDLLKRGRSGETINHYFNTLSKLFQMLVGDWDLDIPNPIRGIKRMPASQGRSKRVKGNIEEHLLKSCTELSLPLLSSIIKFAIQTGMRRGELMGLNWSDIDLPNRRAYLHTSKNGEPRQVPLSQLAVSILQSLGRDNEGCVFPMSLNVLRNQFEHARAHSKESWCEAGVNPFIGLRFHDLRHEALSRLSDAGLNVIELSHISGHKTLGMLKRYTHPSHEAIFLKMDRH
jgi:integrase